MSGTSIGIDVGGLLDNLDDIPDDPSEIEALLDNGFEAAEKDDTSIVDEADAETEAETTDPEPETEAADEDTTGDSQDKDSVIDEELPVVAADGKSQIPYAVLKTARDQNSALQQQLDDANAKLEQQSVTQEAPAEEEPAAEAPAEVTFDDRFKTEHGMSRDEFKEEFGAEMATLTETQLKRTVTLETKLAELDERQQEIVSREESRTASEQKDVQDDIQVAIDSIPVLADWQANNLTMWAAAVAVDQSLRNDPAFADATYEARFQEVVKVLGRGETKAAEPSKEELEKKAADAEAKADDNSVPTSLSDAPGAGEPAAQSEVERVESLSPTQLEAMFEKMTPDQQEAYLAKM